MTKFQDAQHLMSRDLRELEAGPFIGNGVSFEKPRDCFPKGTPALTLLCFQSIVQMYLPLGFAGPVV